MELWDLYDENRRPLGQTMARGEPVEAGCFHQTVEIWTINTNRKILLTLRDPDKPEYPNLWECTGGSVLAGESSLDAAVRELFEETGIAVQKSELTLILSRRKGECFCDSYLLLNQPVPQLLRLQPGETVDARWVSMPQLEEMLEAGLIARPVEESLFAVREQLERVLAGEPAGGPENSR